MFNWQNTSFSVVPLAPKNHIPVYMHQGKHTEAKGNDYPLLYFINSLKLGILSKIIARTAEVMTAFSSKWLSCLWLQVQLEILSTTMWFCQHGIFASSVPTRT